MLSVQTAGCAGMERLGVPTRTTLNTPPDDRGQFSCRMRVDALQAREFLAVHSETVIRGNNSGGSLQKQQHQHQQQQHHNQHSHHQHQHQHQHQHHHNYQQHYPRMTTPLDCGSGHMPARNLNLNTNTITNSSSNINASNKSISNSANDGSSNANSKGNGGNSNFVRGGIEASTLKYGNTGSGCKRGGSSDGDGYNHSYGGSSCSCGSSVNSHSNDHHQHFQYQLQQQQTLHCPHHVPRWDDEGRQMMMFADRNSPTRPNYQSEITRTYIKPPPNKTVKDVPMQSAALLSAFNNGTAAHFGVTPSPSPSASTLTGTAAIQLQHQPNKSGKNMIAKFFSRRNNPKSPTTAMSSSSSSTSTSTSTCSSLASSASVTSMPPMTPMPSASSSASSLASAAVVANTSTATAGSTSVPTSSSASSLSSVPIPSLPISTASALKTTPCNYGPSNNILAGLTPSTQLLTTIGVPTTATTTTPPTVTTNFTMPVERIATPPLSVNVPISSHHQHLHQHQHQQHHQQQQLKHQPHYFDGMNEQLSTAATGDGLYNAMANDECPSDNENSNSSTASGSSHASHGSNSSLGSVCSVGSVGSAGSKRKESSLQCQ